MGSSTSRSKTWSAEWRRLCATLVLAAAPAVATAQDAPDSGIADAVLRLAGTAAGNALPVGGRLYGGTVERSLIVDPDGGIPDFTGNDFVTFLIRRDDLVLDCGVVTRAGLEACIRTPDNTRRLLDILFPGSLSSNLSGRDQAQLFAHQFLQTTAFGMTAVSENGKARRTEIGALVEREWFTSAAGYHGQAWQGLYQFTGSALSVSGRYATQDDVLRTRSTTVMADCRPSIALDERGDWRVGLTARTGMSYASSTDLDLGYDRPRRRWLDISPARLLPVASRWCGPVPGYKDLYSQRARGRGLLLLCHGCQRPGHRLRRDVRRSCRSRDRPGDDAEREGAPDPHCRGF